MIRALSLREIAQACDGALFGDDLTVDSICTDSRKIDGACLYVALRGEQFDGHNFASQALQAGAVAILADHSMDISAPVVVVADTQRALGRIARLERDTFSGKVLALTGSCGKTTTKACLRSILAQRHNVHATRGNLNNEIGVPLTLFELTADHELAVIEMGAAAEGDIAWLCEIAAPDVAAITNAQAAHIEGFGSLDGVARGKGEIYQTLSENGVAIINADDQYADYWRQVAAHCDRQICVSQSDSGAELFASDITLSASGSRFRLNIGDESCVVELPLPGRHMVANALTAAGIAFAIGEPLSTIAEGLAAVEGEAGRMQAMQLGELTLIDDSYNANPAAVKAAIDVLAAAASPSTLVLGDMAELGENSASLHTEIGRYAASAGIKQFWCGGKFASDYAAGYGEGARAFASRDALQSELLAAIPNRGTLLIKGSRSAGMEALVSAISAAKILNDNSGGGDAAVSC